MSESQSVCKHCGQKLVRRPADRHNWYDPKGGVWCNATKYKSTHEPVSEPASTGEPPPSGDLLDLDWDRVRELCLEHGVTDADILKHRLEDHARWHADIISGRLTEAARPSEPSAPQTNVPYLKRCAAEGWDCGCVDVCKFAAAPQPVSGLDPRPDLDWPLDAIRKNQSAQPVSGDAPDFDAIARDFLRSDEWRAAPLCGAWEERLLAGLLKKLAGDAPKVEEIAATVAEAIRRTQRLTNQYRDSVLRPLITDALRPYFPPASQNSDKVEVSPAVYGNLVAIWQTALMLFGGPPDELPNVENMRRRMHEAATPASTARKDGWVSVEEMSAPKKGNFLAWDANQNWIGVAWQDVHGNVLYTGGIRLNHFTHWRELPAAPGSVPQAEPPKCQIIGCNNKVAEMRHCVEHLPGNFPPDEAGR